MTKERTSLPAWKQTHRALKQYKPDSMNWPEFMALVAEDFQDGDTATMIEEMSNADECVDLTPVMERLERIESATKEATNAAQAAEKSVNNLKR